MDHHHMGLRPHASFWQTTRFRLDLTKPWVMGIVNVTPDSFSDGGQHFAADVARAHCEQLLQEGADMLDIGGESTRPGALPVSAEDEWARVQPVLQHVLTLGVPISVDTYKPRVMQWALDAGADIINDVWAMRWRGDSAGASPSVANAAQVIAQHGSCGVCLMHMHREPQTMQTAPMEGDAVPQVAQFLRDAALGLEAAGVARARICLDYGIGFGKTPEGNLRLVRDLALFAEFPHPLLVGLSRKSLITRTLGIRADEALSATSALHALALERGAQILRVHDPREARQVIQLISGF